MSGYAQLKAGIPTVTALQALRRAAMGVAALDTCYPDDAEKWLENGDDDPLIGHCAAVAFVARSLFGGHILTATHPTKGRHAWNMLPGGYKVDLTEEDLHPRIHYGRKFKPMNTNPRFLLFKQRVLEALRMG
jgi:hypothetical protein